LARPVWSDVVILAVAQRSRFPPSDAHHDRGPTTIIR